MNKQLFMLRSLNFLYYATSAMLLPFIPVFFEEKGFGGSQVGLLMTFGPFVAIFAQPLWGYVSDRYHSLKWIIFSLWTLSLLCSVGVYYADDYASSFLYMGLLYFFLLPSSPLLDSLTIKSTIENGVSYGSVRMYGSLGFTVVAGCAGFILGKMGGMENLFQLYWMLWIVPLIMILFLKDEISAGASLTLRSLEGVLKNGKLLWFLFIVLVLMLPHRMNDALLTLHLRDLGATESMLGLAWALAALSEVPTFALLGRYLHKVHELALIGIVAVLYIVRWLMYWAVDDPFVLMLLQMSHSITYAVFWLAAVQYAVRIVPDELRSTGQSLLAAVFLGVAGIGGGYFGGVIKDHSGGAAMYAYGSILAAVAALLLFATHIRRSRLD